MKFDAFWFALGAAQTLLGAPLLARAWKRRHRSHLGFGWERLFGPKTRIAPSRGVRLVMVGLGYAESRWALELGRQIQSARPDVEIVWAIFHGDSVLTAKALPAAQTMVAPPFDYAPAVSLWLGRVRPDAVVFLEKFLYANFARGAHLNGIRVGAVAARLRDHRGGRYKWGAFYGRWLLSSFDLIGLRSEREREHLGALGDLPNVRVTGSLKFWPQIPEIEAGRRAELDAWLALAAKRPILAAGSTQPGDETWILEAFAPLRAEFGAVLLVAPRHPERAGEVEALCHARGWKVARRSRAEDRKAEDRKEDVDVLLLDTIGELMTAYGAARAAFVGGTLSGTGHNVLEPIAHGIAVFYGPKRGTFGAEQEMCEAAGVGFRVGTPQELTQGWREILSNPKRGAAIAQKARDFNAQGAQAWGRTVDAILEMLGDKRG